MRWPSGARRRKQRKERGQQSFDGWPHGLNTSVPSQQISKTELSKCVNYKINAGGQLETRRPLKRYTNSPTTSNAAIVAHKKVVIDFLTFEVVGDANNLVYYVSVDELIHVGTASGPVQFVNYNGTCVVLDGSYVKYLPLAAGASLALLQTPVIQIGDAIALMGIDSASLKIAYDDGSGSTGAQFDTSSGANDGSLPLGNGTNIRIAYKFTSQTWDAGFTIPLTKVYAKLSKTLLPTGDITCKLRLVSDDSVLASKVFKASADLTGTATEYSTTFTADDITTEMSPGVAYYISLEFANGDAANYVNVHYTDNDAAGGVGFKYIAAWSAETGIDPIMRVNPGRPPKGSFGDVHAHRLFIAGNADEPGYIYYSNLTHLDWSTADGGGYVGAVDDNANTFEVGGLITQFGALMVYGTQTLPYLARLEGTSPSGFTVPTLMQKAWTLSKSLVSTFNDVWSASREGVDTLLGTQYYGDVRSSSVSESVEDRFEDYWSTSTIVGHNPIDGEVWVVMPNYHRVLVFSVLNPIQGPVSQRVKYPSYEYEFYRDNFSNTDDYQWVANGSEYYLQAAAGGDPGIDAKPDHITIDGRLRAEGTAGSLNELGWDYALDPGSAYYTVYIKDSKGTPATTGLEVRSILVPTWLSSYDSEFFIGGSDGYIAKFDTDHESIREFGNTTIDYIAKTSFVQSPFSHINMFKQRLFATAYGGAYATLRLRKNDLTSEYVHDYDYVLALSDAMTVDEATMLVSDATYLIDQEETLPWKFMNVDCYSFQAEIKDVLPISAGNPLYINGILFEYRRLEK
jgi:hypothetical protein